MADLTAVSLFAGIGGFDLALERSGVRVVASVEIDNHAQGVLRRHFPNSQIFGDITGVSGEQLISAGFTPEHGVIVGGFPCQDLSVAGKRAGLAGARSGLFWEICRLLDETKAKYFILENVPGLLTSNGGRDMGVVIGALADRGYSIAWRVLDAQFFGVPQRRRRVFLVGCAGDDWRSPTEILNLLEGSTGDTTKGRQARKSTARASAESSGESSDVVVFYGNRVDDIRVQDDKINTLQARMGTGGNNMPMVMQDREGKPGGGKGPLVSDKSFSLRTSNFQTLFTSTVRKLTPTECERLQGFPDGWTNGQANGHRYKQLGNAVAVPVVEWMIRRLIDSATSMESSTE